MKFLKPLILEKKQLGDLYHIVDYEKMMYILKNNKITSYRAGGGKISLTRNKMLNSYLGDSPQSFLKLLIDGDGLSDNYKIKPFAYKSLNNQRFTEYEEQVQTREIKNAFSYIKKVILVKSRVLNLMFNVDGCLSDYFTTVGSATGSMPDIISDVITNLKKYNKELYIQDGTVIKKDDNFIDYILNFPIRQINRKNIILYRGKKEDKENWLGQADILVDNKDNIVMSNLVVGNSLDLPLSKIKYDEFDSMSKKKHHSRIITKYSPKYKFEPYLVIVRELDDNEWKIDDIRPLDWL